ncbi:MAG: N-acetyltransferase [Actinomycetota bacterium]|nr:N-acetyltransferase [Actinomycetota bacterium]
MSLQIVQHSDRPELAAVASELGDVWPEYNKHGDVLNVYWRFLYETFEEFQFLLYDAEQDAVLGEGHSIPCVWNGTMEGLPAGIDEVIEQGFDVKSSGAPVNTLSALAVEIAPPHRGRGLSRVMIGAMRDIAARHGYTNLIAPVRPSWKERYPLTPIEKYIRWTTDGGQPFDPWMNVHHKLGAEILKPAPRSLQITGTVREWEEWTEMSFPESGRYLFPHGLAPMEIDIDDDRGRYWEPNVWMRHPVDP